MNHHEALTVIGVGGGGCHLDTASIVFRMVRSQVEDAGMPYIPIHGCTDGPDKVRVLAPSDQQALITDTISNLPKSERVLLVGQCIGGIAIVNFLLEDIHKTDTDVRAIIFSPATNPAQVIQSPESRSRRHNNDRTMRLQRLDGDTRTYEISISHEIDAELPESYISEAHYEGEQALGKMAKLVDMGRLALYATQNDWNQESPRAIDLLQRERGNSTSGLYIVEGAGHSLHTPRSVATPGVDTVQQQYGRVATMLNTGAALLSKAPALVE